MQYIPYRPHALSNYYMDSNVFRMLPPPPPPPPNHYTTKPGSLGPKLGRQPTLLRLRYRVFHEMPSELCEVDWLLLSPLHCELLPLQYVLYYFSPSLAGHEEPETTNNSVGKLSQDRQYLGPILVQLHLLHGTD